MISLSECIRLAIKEDIGKGDISSLAVLPTLQQARAVCLVKAPCTIAGLEIAEQVCVTIDPSLNCNWLVKDGDSILENQIIGSIIGSIHSILKAERLLLNILQRMSGIATKTARLVALVKPYGTIILDTRKTTPNFRICEKRAVRIGGGSNHRMGLDDMILIKDNHIAAAGGIHLAIENCLKYSTQHQLELPIIIEVKNEEEFSIAAKFDEIDRILVDNFTPAELKKLVAQNHKHRKLEASGGINEMNVVEYAQSGVDYLSIGNLTHHVESVDISLKINEDVIH
ncbi:MAG: carboxylating nicotinate-nucleotide diphosphorylase [Sphingobacteriaceae bacterium]